MVVTERDRIKFITKINQELTELNGNQFLIAYLDSYWFESEPRDPEFMKSELIYYDFRDNYGEHNFFSGADFVDGFWITDSINSFLKCNGGKILRKEYYIK